MAINVNKPTGLGNQFSVQTFEAPTEYGKGDSYDRPELALVTYHDDVGYFGGAKSIGASVGEKLSLSGAGGPPEATSRQDQISLRKVADDVYQGVVQVDRNGVTGDTQLDLNRLDLAFGQDGQWDSNQGQNYSVAVD